ncbi:hypothetical protein WEN_01315 [Mycoplasma wenyonii str. Massachusetts]|uniref:Uncharacterized protein n=1 Tax=Mycoplasma wenyonii (strain Massachusetts) TaxID=1197325 RepID=I6ZEP0_MYCWM|nr:hypothetical protein [Mycoplasma wenyonii]AFN65062.1 hypothetical protein WEN_01315 [Mycoplasma wenyonii str. Massachusetts]
MLFLKFVLAILGGGTGIVSFTSLSSLEWDPEHVWRAGAKDRFYLFTCRQRKEKDDEGDKKWIYSDLSVYLTFKKGGVSKVTEGAELQLVGEGHYQSFQNTRPIYDKQYETKADLHKTIDSKQTWFTLSVGRTSKNNWLGETGGGEDSSRWGLLMRCDKRLFTFANFEDAGVSDQKDSHLSKISFSLGDCNGQRHYRGVKGCSIKIKSDDTVGACHSKDLKWAEGFNPIVIE